MQNFSFAACAFGLGLLAAPVFAQNQQGLVVRYIESLPKQSISAQERADLIWMREEEKLARDVYQVFYAVWKVPAFQNISKSEQNHMDLVKVALDRYGIPDPLPSLQLGVFRSPVMTSLFQTLVLFGLASPAHAEVAAAFIEDLDISDLRDALTRTDNRDLAVVYQNLQLGSRNHMRAFYSLLAAQNLYYPGLVLPKAEILKIVNTPHERGAVDENGKPLH